MAGSVTELASKLYDACQANFASDHLFYQHDLLGLGVVPKNDLPLMLQCTQTLVDQKLFRLLAGKNDRLAWKIISREDADKYVLVSLTSGYPNTNRYRLDCRILAPTKVWCIM